MKYSLFKVFMSPDVIKPVNDVLLSGYITQGKQVEEFENKLKEFTGNPYVVTLNSATSGLTLALRLLKKSTYNWPGLTDDDIVLTTALTCTATNWPILANGLKLKWVDVDPHTCNINLDDLREKMTEKTKVWMFVHWGGDPVDLDRVNELKEEYKERYGFYPYVIEDCAHAFGAEYNNKKIGNYGNICVFSFQAIKHLTTADGGMITLPNEELYERSKLLRWYGIDRDKRNYKGKDFRLEHDVAEWGYKFHMNDVNATLGLYNLPHIPGMLEKNRRNSKIFDQRLSGVEGIELLNYDHYLNKNKSSAYWLYTIKILGGRKQEFMDYMNDKGIMVSQVHNRNDYHSCVREFRSDLPILDELEKKIVCIPVGWWLDESDVNYVCDNVICCISCLI